MKRYWVTCVRYGCIAVEANSESEALDIANHQLTGDVCWSDDWIADAADEDPTLTSEECIKVKAFE